MKTKIYIRTDGNSLIGLGHVVRCIALAQMLKNKFDISFVCKEINEAVIKDIDELGFNLFQIHNEEELITLLSGNKIVVLDHYTLDSEFQKRIKATGCKLVCIDDLHNKTYYADLIINHSPVVYPGDYLGQPYTHLALGLDYALLRPQFLKQAKNKVRYPIETVLVCFGGADSKNLTLDVARLLLENSCFKKIIIITGSAYSHLSSLEGLVKDSNIIDHHHSVDENLMAELIEASDLAIVPVSGILLEVLALDRKVIAGFYNENHQKSFDKFKNLDAFISAEDFSTSNLTNALNEALSRETWPKVLIDGKSNERILKLFMDLNHD